MLHVQTLSRLPYSYSWEALQLFLKQIIFRSESRNVVSDGLDAFWEKPECCLHEEAGVSLLWVG